MIAPFNSQMIIAIQVNKTKSSYIKSKKAYENTPSALKLQPTYIERLKPNDWIKFAETQEPAIIPIPN